MNTQKTTYTAVAAVVAAALVIISSPANAQRDAGAKIRGDYSFGGSPRSYSQGFVQPQRSFSYEPAEAPAARRGYSYVADMFHVGDKATVSAHEAKLMIGTETHGTVDKGTTFEIRKVEGPWLWTEVEIDGKKLSGWVWFGSVTLAGQSSGDTAARPQAARRSFSYEPSYETGRRSSSPRKPLWEYPKTDPRRYRP